MIETWWLNYTFTLNWKLVEPGTVFFARGESLGQLVPVPHATFQNATALEAPIGLLEPDAAQELLQWQERRRQLAGQKVNVHHLYRKAEGIEEHLQRVPVPADPSRSNLARGSAASRRIGGNPNREPAGVTDLTGRFESSRPDALRADVQS